MTITPMAQIVDYDRHEIFAVFISFVKVPHHKFISLKMIYLILELDSVSYNKNVFQP